MYEGCKSGSLLIGERGLCGPDPGSNSLPLKCKQQLLQRLRRHPSPVIERSWLNIMKPVISLSTLNTFIFFFSPRLHSLPLSLSPPLLL